MNQFLSDRVMRKLDTLPDERVYQVLDYIEFLESKYAEVKAAPPGVFQRFAEGVEDTMRAGKVSAGAVAETMSLLSKAMGVLSGVAAAGKSVATDLVGGSIKQQDKSPAPAKDTGQNTAPVTAPATVKADDAADGQPGGPRP